MLIPLSFLGALSVLGARSLTPEARAEPLTTALVGQHDQPGDCWALIDGVVYDLSPWVGAHPGGEAITRACGKDATWLFHHREAAGGPSGGQSGGHSAAAAALLPSLALGPLGAEAPASVARPVIHPHAARLEGARVGLLPSSGVGPAKSVALRVGHQLSTGDAASGIGVQLGYSTGWMDVLVSDQRAPGLGALEVKVRPLAQHGAVERPLSISLGAGGGYASAAEVPALFGALVLERDALDRRLSARLVGDGGLSPGEAESAQASAGVGLEFRPIPIHSLFGELVVPLGAPESLAWSAGARLFTRSHSFSIYVASTPALSPWELAGPTAETLSIGLSMERAFRL